MKARWNILFACFAVAALVLAASCSDDPTGDLSGQSESVESTDSTGSQNEQSADEGEQYAGGSRQSESEQDEQGVSENGESVSESEQDAGEGEQNEQIELQAITEDDVLTLMQEIGKIDGCNSEPAPNTYWDFPNAELSKDAGGVIAIVPWFQTAYNSGVSPFIAYTRLKLRARGEVSTSLLSVDLSGAEWDEYEEEDASGRTQTEKEVKGKRYVTVTIELVEGASRELPEELRSVTIALDSGEIQWRNSL